MRIQRRIGARKRARGSAMIGVVMIVVVIAGLTASMLQFSLSFNNECDAQIVDHGITRPQKAQRVTRHHDPERHEVENPVPAPQQARPQFAARQALRVEHVLHECQKHENRERCGNDTRPRECSQS